MFINYIVIINITFLKEINITEVIGDRMHYAIVCFYTCSLINYHLSKTLQMTTQHVYWTYKGLQLKTLLCLNFLLSDVYVSLLIPYLLDDNSRCKCKHDSFNTLIMMNKCLLFLHNVVFNFVLFYFYAITSLSINRQCFRAPTYCDMIRLPHILSLLYSWLFYFEFNLLNEAKTVLGVINEPKIRQSHLIPSM